MNTKLSIVSVPLLLIFSITINNASALSCALIELGDTFDDSEYAFHGKVTDKNYLTWDQDIPVITFEIIESFKGDADGQISVTVYEQWSYDFEVGLEYVVFVQRDQASLKIEPCTPFFQAFSSSIDIMRMVSTPGNDMKYQTSNVFYEALSDQEKIQLEKNNEFLKEKRIEREDAEIFQKQVFITIFILAAIITVFVAFIKFRKNRE
ncbi:MAG: hypothetical protein PVI88_06695 [Nitrosopumilaceae archaeon]|jgi:hypothetical protein